MSPNLVLAGLPVVAVLIAVLGVARVWGRTPAVVVGSLALVTIAGFALSALALS